MRYEKSYNLKSSLIWSLIHVEKVYSTLQKYYCKLHKDLFFVFEKYEKNKIWHDEWKLEVKFANINDKVGDLDHLSYM